MTLNKIYDILLYAVIGDALGTPLDGLSKGHVNSIFKNIEKYVDPLPALKGKTWRWRKPGLYSAISQLGILSMMHIQKGNFSVKKYANTITDSPEIQDSPSGIFRYADNAVENFILSCRSNNKLPTSALPSAGLPIITMPIFFNQKNDSILQAVTMAGHVTKDISTIAGCAIYGRLISYFLDSEHIASNDILSAAAENIKASVAVIEQESSAIFELGLNPDSFLSAVSLYVRAFEAAAKHGTNEEREKRLLSIVNTAFKTPAVRLTVPHPLAIIPYSLYLVYKHNGAPSGLFRIAEEGGSAAALTACAASFLGILNNAEDIPEPLLEGLVNRKRVLNIINSISQKQASEPLVEEFINSEFSLSQKALEELKARTKSQNSAPKKIKPLDKEHQLAKHVVESWTKIDKAKWKKERRKTERE